MNLLAATVRIKDVRQDPDAVWRATLYDGTRSYGVDRKYGCWRITPEDAKHDHRFVEVARDIAAQIQAIVFPLERKAKDVLHSADAAKDTPTNETKEHMSATATAEKPAAKAPKAKTTKAKVNAAKAAKGRVPAKSTLKPSANGNGDGIRPGSSLDMARDILRKAKGPMHYKDITEKIMKRKGHGLNGKTPVATMSAQMLVGVNKGVFVKTDKATFDLKELNPRGAKTRPAK